MVRAGGWALILGALGFLAVFSYLAARFNYPAVLDGPAGTVLPRLAAMGPTGRAVWAVYAFLPLIWIPAGTGAYYALRRTHPGAMLLALQCAFLAALSMMAGLMRWPTIHWRLTGAAGVVGMFRNVTATVSPVAAINNYLLPLWMIAFGILLLRQRPEQRGIAGA